MKGYLILEDGSLFVGKSIGGKGQVISEIVFNTSMTGYMEILTDPSYGGEAVVMTYPLIGNYGICLEDRESARPHVDGFIVGELSYAPSNFRNEIDVDTYLKIHNVSGIAGIDTRALTRLLRRQGTMNGMITTQFPTDWDKTLECIREYKVKNVVKNVSVSKKELACAGKYKVGVIDCGTKGNIIKELAKRDCQVTIYPYDTLASQLLEDGLEGIMLSNGPGDPKDCGKLIEEIKKLVEAKIPIFGICLGHQLLALAHGGNTRKMRWGHRGSNHPVKDLETNRIYISSQNHGYVVEEESIAKEIGSVRFINCNDGSIEGIRYHQSPSFSVQFHPEAHAGHRIQAIYLIYF